MCSSVCVCACECVEGISSVTSCMTHVVCKRILPPRVCMCFAIPLDAPDLSLYVEKPQLRVTFGPHTTSWAKKIQKNRLKKTEENAIEKCSLCWLFSDFYQAPRFLVFWPNRAKNQRLKAVDVQLFRFTLFFWSLAEKADKNI